MMFLEPEGFYRMKKAGASNQLEVINFAPSPESVLVSAKQLASSLNESFPTEQEPQGTPIKIFAFLRA